MKIINFRNGNLKGSLEVAGEKRYIATTATVTKEYKTERGARAFLIREGYTEIEEIVEVTELVRATPASAVEPAGKGLFINGVEVARVQKNIEGVTYYIEDDRQLAFNEVDRETFIKGVARYEGIAKKNASIYKEYLELLELVPAEPKEVLERAVTIDKYTLKFNCPSEDGLTDEGCRDKCDQSFTACRKCWNKSIASFLGDTNGKNSEALLGFVAREDIQELRIEEYNTKLVFKCFINGLPHSWEYDYGYTRDGLVDTVKDINRIMREQE